MKFANGAAVVALVLAGCSAPTSAATSPTPSQNARVITAFDLYTHCGIREAKIGSDFYAAEPVLGDGNGNPPAGWGNPGQSGTMTVYQNGTAHFAGPGGLTADFRLRPGATSWAMLCS